MMTEARLQLFTRLFGNIIKKTDSYKPSHWKQYPKRTRYIRSYLESRGSVTDRFGNPRYRYTVPFGLYYYLRMYLAGKVITREMIEECKVFFEQHLGPDIFNYDGWIRMLEKHGGRLPIQIEAVKEGTVVPLSNVLMSVVNTDPEFPWITNYIETLLVLVWYPTTIATNSRHIKEICKTYHELTSDAPIETIDFQVHDFGFRGVSSVESAGIGDAGHLVSFMGTDTLMGIDVIQQVYEYTKMPAFSIPASEHSTMTLLGREGEPDQMERMLDQYPTGLVACVSDSYDIMNAVNNIWGDKLRDKILNRDGRLVIRPDSGDPVITTQKIVYALWNKFGGTTNSKGYRVLHDNVRIIQGDGIDMDTIEDILQNFQAHGFSSENIVFGSGGGLLQKFDRDTLKFAFKCSYADIAGNVIDVRKSPKEFTEDGEYVQSFKTSKAGDLALVKDEDGTFRTVQREEAGDNNLLNTVFLDGYIMPNALDSFDNIRERAKV